MEISVRLYGTLREQLPKEQKGRGTLTLEEGATIAAALNQLGIDVEQVLFAVNEAHEMQADAVLEDGDVLAVFTHVAGG